MRQVTLPDGTRVPCLGQGTWHMGERGCDPKAEAAALCLGLDLGMSLIDTAEMYADGGSEMVVAAAMAGRRDEVFLVSKAYPQNASRTRLPQACEASLHRLNTDRLDLYLLHWRGGVPLAETVEAFEKLRAAGKIRRWGVSNLDPDDIAELLEVPGGRHCAVNQVLYNPQYRGIEFDLLPQARPLGMPIMAYSPVGQGGSLLRHKTLVAIAARRDATPAQVALAWALRHPDVIAIPKAATADHVRQNVAALSVRLDASDLQELDRAFPAPSRAQPLAML